MAWFSVESFMSKLKGIIPRLQKQEKELLRAALEHAKNERDFMYIRDWLKEPDVWMMPMVSLDTFLDDPYYLWIWDIVYPKVREIVRDILEWWYREAIEIAGIWAWKSYSSELIACYQAHKLLCMRDPFRFHKLGRDKPISIINMGTSATQALNVVFAGITHFIENSPFFTQFSPTIKQGKITFEENNITLISGNSKATTPLGYNVYCGILDEAAFFMDDTERSVAQEIYESLQRRIVSRFGKNGLMVMISSPRYTEDFLMRKMNDSLMKDANGNLVAKDIYSIQLPTWKVKKPTEDDLEDWFLFKQNSSEILDMDLEDAKKLYKVNEILNPEFDITYDVWQIPSAYKNSFAQNPDQAKRDFWATPTEAIAGFFSNPVIIKNMWNTTRADVVTWPGTYRFPERPLRTRYYIHVDIWLNKNGWDFTWFAMGHAVGRVENEWWEKRLEMCIDLIERIGADENTGEVDIWSIRERIYGLKAMWYYIYLVTFDWYQSKDSMQMLKKNSINADYLSVDRTVDPYNNLKMAIYENRLDIYYNEVLQRELLQLELIRGTKVDHINGWSKDLADAVAGVVQNIVNNTPMWAASIRVEGATATTTSSQREALRKVKLIEMQARILGKQDEIHNRMVQEWMEI